jgi:hypothetical protein
MISFWALRRIETKDVGSKDALELKTESHIDAAKYQLFEFVNAIPVLYSDIDILKLYNCHIILHYPESVRNLGPLWSHLYYITRILSVFLSV